MTDLRASHSEIDDKLAASTPHYKHDHPRNNTLGNTRLSQLNPPLPPQVLPTMSSPRALRIGYVPEHYLLPLHLSLPHLTTSNLQIDLIPFPAGTGAMILSLRASEIDLAVGLTEGWVAGLLSDANRAKGGYSIVGSWCRSPLRWAVVTGRNRREIDNVGDLARNRRVGVSRMGSGSHVMATVLAEREGWLRHTESASGEKKELEFVPLGPFKELRDGVTGLSSANDTTAARTTATVTAKSTSASTSNVSAARETADDQPNPKADFFMWEHFTSTLR